MHSILRNNYNSTFNNKNRCIFYIGFLLPNHMKINITLKISALPVAVMLVLTGCEKKYQSPDHYKIDYFKNERQEGKAYIMNEDECFDASELVIGSSSVKLVDSSSGRGKPFFLYQVRSGKILKTVRDSVMNYPFMFLSHQRLKLKNDSMYLYLKRLEGYNLIREDRNLNYQWLKAAPVYSIKKDE
ncbi:hypothetical protein AOB46_20795 [Chryseobacterium indologenes]|uniref:Lipoprotein n=2 Tax=Chryseobacterium indologenes TaxID=253 RepID=A0A0N0ZUE9_CHRID|nr:hypothetical protein AOB46_20795 [Chryseobacterium indologenes]